MAIPKIGKKAPAFNLPATGEQKIASKDLKGSMVVLYFYPKDSTPGCTTESQDFRDLHKKFERLGVIILGVSRDSIRSHENFKKKQSLPFELLSDEEEVLCTKYDVVKLKKLYGREYMGIERSTFLIDAEGVLQEEWRKVKVKNHAQEVLEAATALSQQ